MYLPKLVPLGWVLAIAVNAQSPSSSSSTDQTVSTGSSEISEPTGSYITDTTQTTESSSAISTSPLLSTITSPSTFTTTIGSTTLFGVESIFTSNITGGSEPTKTSSQIILQGSSQTTTSTTNGTSNSTTTTSTSYSVQPTNTTPCNNYPEFCSRSYGNITEVSAHNSPFIQPNNAASNQALDVTTQLNDEIRQVQAQMHWLNGVPPSLPHNLLRLGRRSTTCSVLDAGPLPSYLSTIYQWVRNHPTDIITILLENGDYRPVNDYVPFIQQSGLTRDAFIPPKIPMNSTDWPTLSSMILTGKRVVFFMDYNANQTLVPWMLDQFSQLWETPFDPTNRTLPCIVQRPPNLSNQDAKSRLYMINHNLNYEISLLGNSFLVPNILLLNITNNITGEGSLGEGTESCVEEWGNPPKFLNVDYYDVGRGVFLRLRLSGMG